MAEGKEHALAIGYTKMSANDMYGFGPWLFALEFGSVVVCLNIGFLGSIVARVNCVGVGEDVNHCV